MVAPYPYTSGRGVSFSFSQYHILYDQGPSTFKGRSARMMVKIILKDWHKKNVGVMGRCDLQSLGRHGVCHNVRRHRGLAVVFNIRQDVLNGLVQGEHEREVVNRERTREKLQPW